MGTAADIADAVVATINAADLGQPVTAERVYLPILDLQEAGELRVRVVPAATAVAVGDRKNLVRSYRIEIGVQRKLASDDPAEIDPLLALASAIEALFTAKPLEGFPQAKWQRTDHDPLVAPEHLHELRQFTSLIVLTYRVWSVS
jgi:hypothetical protein